MIIADTPDQIELFRLIASKHAILLEAKGLRHSRLGRNGLKRAWAKHYGMSARSSHLSVIARLQEDIFVLADRINAPKQEELSL